MILHSQRWYKISEVQLTALRKGWTHTTLDYDKGILQRVEEDQMIDCGCASHSQQSDQDTLKQKYNQLMAASINNEHPGWVQIADIERILKPFDITPDIENLQEFPFRSYPKKETRPSKTDWCKNTFCPDCPDSDTCSESKK